MPTKKARKPRAPRVKLPPVGPPVGHLRYSAATIRRDMFENVGGTSEDRVLAELVDDAFGDDPWPGTRDWYEDGACPYTRDVALDLCAAYYNRGGAALKGLVSLGHYACGVCAGAAAMTCIGLHHCCR